MAGKQEGGIYRRGGVWWIVFYHNGTRHRESTRSTRKADAVQLRKKRLGQSAEGKVTGADERRVMFEDLCDGILTDYKVNGRRSVKRLRASLKHLARTFAGNTALSITVGRVKSYIADRQEEGASASSIQKELAALKRAFRLAVLEGRLSAMPAFPSIAVRNEREGFLSAADLERLVAELPDYLRPLTRFAFATGWRRGECVGLKWSDVDFEAGVVRVEASRTKTAKARTFPFGALPSLTALLEAQRAATRAQERETGQLVPYVFHRAGEPIRSFYGAWRSACERAGLPGTLFHDLRRSAVVRFERAGISRSVSMKLSGHRTQNIFDRYAIADAAALEEGVEKLAALDGAEPAEPRKVVPIDRTG
ncbi:MAG TPA: tyrosine-type recombinase/integrase [Longimicrobiales bacterium]|nr:tyrosine-type recombinase/integrase [Longimicrobiales bacterium]